MNFQGLYARGNEKQTNPGFIRNIDYSSSTGINAVNTQINQFRPILIL